jgi:hypothetical protein
MISGVTAGMVAQPNLPLADLDTLLSTPQIAPPIKSSGSPGNPSSWRSPAFPSGVSEAPRGISGPQAHSFPAERLSGPPLTYRAGEVSRLQASQSMDPMQQRSMSRPSAIGMAHATARPAPPAHRPSVAPEARDQSGSRLWIVGAVILVLLLGAAIVLLRMVQTGALLLF